MLSKLGISFLILFILALRILLVAKLVIPGILFSIFFNFTLYASFLTTSFFTASFSLVKSTGAGTSSSLFNWSILFSNLLKLIGTFLNLTISNLFTSEFKLPEF